MKKTITLLMSAVLGLSPAVARQLSPAQALDNALRHAAAHKPMLTGISMSSPVLTGSVEGINTYYIFNSADGQAFAIVAADDVAAPVLGYGNGALDPQDMPEALQEMLDGYSREIAAAVRHGAPAYQPHYAPVGEPIEPFGKTKWNQDAPYNTLCPTLNGRLSTAGCAATAAAQCVKVFNYPERGIGNCTYEYNYMYVTHTDSFDFENTPFDWDNMLDSYSGEYTQPQLDAIATLMHACGVASSMHYSPSASWCNLEQVGVGLIKWLGYDIGMQCLYRSYYTSDEWLQIVYDEVAAGRPVLYTGYSDLTGHAFMCDGYSKGDYFHINWGWSGHADGYYKLDALDPNNNNHGFNYQQAMIIGIQPPVEGAIKRPVMYCSGNMTYIEAIYERSPEVTAAFNINHGLTGSVYFSESLYPIEVTLGMKCVTPEGETFYLKSTAPTRTLTWGQGWGELTLATMDMPIGKYRMTPAFYALGEWRDIISFATATSVAYANVTDTYICLDENDYVGITDVTADTPETITYTTLSGISVDTPRAPGLYLRTTRYADGTVRTTKVRIR